MKRPGDGLILGLPRIGLPELAAGYAMELVCGIDHAPQASAELFGNHPVQHHLRHGLLTLQRFPPSLRPDDLRQKILFLLGQLDIGIAGLAGVDGRLPIAGNVLRNLSRVKNPAAVPAPDNLPRFKAPGEALLQIPAFVIRLPGVVDHNLSLGVQPLQHQKMLGDRKAASAVHQHNGCLSGLQSIPDLRPGFCLLRRQTQFLNTQLQPGDVVVSSSAEVFRQLHRGIVKSRQGVGHHSQTDGAAPVALDGAAAVALIRVVRLKIQGEVQVVGNHAVGLIFLRMVGCFRPLPGLLRYVAIFRSPFGDGRLRSGFRFPDFFPGCIMGKCFFRSCPVTGRSLGGNHNGSCRQNQNPSHELHAYPSLRFSESGCFGVLPSGAEKPQFLRIEAFGINGFPDTAQPR